MKNEFFYEFNCIKNGEWIPEKVTLEDRLVDTLRFLWNHRYNLEKRYAQHILRNSAARWRFMRKQTEERRKLIQKLRAYRSNRDFAPHIHHSLESWYLQNSEKRMDIAFAVKWLLMSSWAEDPSCFRNAKTWEHKLHSKSG